MDLAFALIGHGLCLGQRQQVRTANALKRVSDNAKTLFVCRIESIGQYAPHLRGLVNDIIRHRVFVWRPCIGQFFRLNAQNSLVVIFVFWLDKDSGNFGFLLLRAIGSAKFKIAQVLENRHAAAHIGRGEVKQRLEKRADTILNSPRAKFRWRPFERIHLVVESSGDLDVFTRISSVVV